MNQRVILQELLETIMKKIGTEEKQAMTVRKKLNNTLIRQKYLHTLRQQTNLKRILVMGESGNKYQMNELCPKHNQDSRKCAECLPFVEREQRTRAQNNSLHLWCEQIAHAYTEKGYTVEEVIKNFKIELFWSKESVKELIIRTAIQRMFGKRSTTELLKNGEEIEKLVDVVTKFNAQMEIDYIPFPSEEELGLKTIHEI